MADDVIMLHGRLGHQELPELVRAISVIDPIFIPNTITFDLSNVTYVCPASMAILSTVILWACTMEIPLRIAQPLNEDVNGYLTRMDFYDIADIHVEYPWNRRNAAGRFREIAQVTSEHESDRTVAELVDILSQQMPIDGIRQAVYYSLAEVVNNVFHHAESPTNAVICAQYYPNRQCIEIAVVDSGRGIPTSLRNNPNINFSGAEEAIQLAIQPRVTGRPGINSGEGLFFTMEFLKANRGDGWLYSLNAAAVIRNGRLQILGQLPLWQGTIVALHFRTTNAVDTEAIFNRFAPPEADYDWLFDDEFPF